MAVDDRLVFSREDELEEESPFGLAELEAESFGPTSEGEMAAGRCPPEQPNVIRGFGQYADNIRRLPEAQFHKLQSIAREIRDSFSGAPGSTPVMQVLIVGHADMDAARERREPGFMQFISEKRALAVYFYLSCKLGEDLASRPRWIRVGRGARTPAVSGARTEAERQCNRRVEITLLRTPERPVLDAGKAGESSLDQTNFLDFYHIALQGTSGQYEQPYVATRKAREIGEKVIRRIEQRARDMRQNRCSEDVKGDFVPYLKDALQGTASKFSDPDVVINKAWEAAEHSRYFVQEQESKKLKWSYATLPQPMDVDCEPNSRVPGGPANHVICRQHGHILDMTSRQVIAHNLEEYKGRSTMSTPKR